MLEFAIGDRRSMARLEAWRQSTQAAHRPGRIPLDEPEDILFNRPPITRRVVAKQPLEVVRQVNDKSHRMIAWVA
jgi:hypothetical protein